MGNLVARKSDNNKQRCIYPSLNKVSVREKYPSNGVHTQKYNVFTFIPINLFEQFHRFANIYFVFILILNFLPEIHAFGKEIAPIPVVFVLAVTAVKDALEDWRRGQSDRRVNEAECLVYCGERKEYVRRQWQKVECGDVIKMYVNETVPADMVLLCGGEDSGMCHLETANIDGESNLKIREVVVLSDNELFHPDILTDRWLKVERPNKEIYKFNGTIYRQGESLGISLGKNNLLLRGCTLRNTKEVVGIVVYTGKETKAMLNNNNTRFKRSKLERQINKDVIWCALLLIILCLFCAIGNLLWPMMTFGLQDVEYYRFPNSTSALIKSAPMQAFLTFWTTVIYYQALIPLPLYVTFELVKMHQVYHIRQDIEMYDEKAKKGLEVRAFNIPEDLGQIQYIFCDKTGTLTENKMEFKRVCIRGMDYVDIDENYENGVKLENENIGNHAQGLEAFDNEGYDASMCDLINLIRNDNYSSIKDDIPLSDVIRDLFLLMAICNTTVVSSNKYEKTPVIKSKKSAIRNKIKKGLQKASEGMSKAASLSTFNAKNIFVKTGRASIRNSEIKEAEHKCHDNLFEEDDSPELLNYKRRESTLPVFEEVNVNFKDESTEENESKSRKVKSVLDFKANLDSIYDDNRDNKNYIHEEGSEDGHIKYNSHSYSDSVDFRDHSNAGDTLTKCPLSDKVLYDSYEAESPDEMALVKTACKYGYKLLQRGPGFVTIWNPEYERPVTYKVLQILSFDSARKRMSVIIECFDTGRIIVYCKGADSAMFGRLLSTVSQSEIEDTKDYLDIYAKKGLRTLVMGKRIISKQFFVEWEQRYKEIEQKLSDNESELSSIICEMEDQMTLIGVSGIEDCLQEGVPDTIESLRRAGITVWILTGDKRETAINIAYSAKLFTDNQRLITLSADSKESAHNLIKENLAEIEGKHPAEILEIRQGRERPLIRKDLALCIDGDTLTLVMAKEIKMDFLRLAEQCRSVVCARTTPLQKAEMVQLVKENLRMQTLAIGDGANDVSMIQTADVGIGIGGNEGMQAVMASDFAMTKFKHLKRLLLVHGSWCYNKLARTALWMFYKDAIYILLMFWFQFFNAFSASVEIDQLTQILFNITMTGLPPIIYGIWDKDHQAETLMSNPQMYSHGINCKSYKPWHFWLNILDSIWQSLVIFFICYGAFSWSDIGIWEFGQVITACALITCVVHLGIETRFWTLFHVLGILISVILAFFVFTFIYNSICGPVVCPQNNPNYFIFSNIQRIMFWLLCIITPAAAILPRLVLNALMNSLRPNILIKAQLRERRMGQGIDLHFDYQPELISIRKTSSIFRRPTTSHLNDISAVYGLKENEANTLKLRPRKMFTMNINESKTQQADARVMSYEEASAISPSNGYINQVLHREHFEDQTFLNCNNLSLSHNDQNNCSEMVSKC